MIDKQVVMEMITGIRGQLDQLESAITADEGGMSDEMPEEYKGSGGGMPDVLQRSMGM